MKFSGILALASLAVGQAAAGLLNHRHFHMRREAHAAPAEVLEKRGVLSATGAALLSKIGFTATGTNSATNNGQAWLGADGPYVNNFINNSTEEIILVVWGPQGSWVNAVKPLIVASIPAGAVQTVSFANGASGAWAPIYPDTTMSPYGQIFQTWGEYTFNGQWSTFDVSREVNMNGKPMTISTSSCTSDFERCVFQCTGGATSCMTGYELYNCAAGSQPGAQSGTYAGAASGGCSGMGDTANITTTFS
ncbi:uncharacterized protein PV09_02253 [Verruconis gallopava]|uniref:Effector 5 n=1 Tax=Verruconis gallopava TaxID=253628 RepID=A0A0D2ALN6_9PEZI|nr:uncharacterized protein PV09_02253 [Verruconis gallopava]KIW07410.1 hypothetical protein PV09_02253 [Verruconis gallopava]